MKTRRKWNLHLDHPWAECVREDGAPKRLYITTPWGFLQIGEKSQVYNPWTRCYTDDWFWITVRPLEAARVGSKVRP